MRSPCESRSRALDWPALSALYTKILEKRHWAPINKFENTFGSAFLCIVVRDFALPSRPAPAGKDWRPRSRMSATLHWVEWFPDQGRVQVRVW